MTTLSISRRAALAAGTALALVLIEQYWDSARSLADRIAVMVCGEVALEGPADESNDGVLQKLLTV